MNDESKEKALPGYKSLAEVQKELIIEQRFTNELLRILITVERGRSEFDVVTHEKWEDAKKKASRATWMQVAIGVAALGVAMIALSSGAVDIEPIMTMMTDAVKAAKGYF